MYGLAPTPIFLSLVRGFVTPENHCRIVSLVTKASVFILNHKFMSLWICAVHNAKDLRWHWFRQSFYLAEQSIDHTQHCLIINTTFFNICRCISNRKPFSTLVRCRWIYHFLNKKIALSIHQSVKVLMFHLPLTYSQLNQHHWQRAQFPDPATGSARLIIRFEYLIMFTGIIAAIICDILTRFETL